MGRQNSLNDEVYRRMNQEIMDLTLEPGLAVSVQKLADAYGVSRTPVREAVIRLQKKGLVEIFPQSKTMISKISMKRTHQERFLRKALELAVVEPFLQNRDEIVIHKMESILASQKEDGSPDYYTKLFSDDNKFHGIIFETANESLSWKTINEVVSHYNRFRLLSTKIKGVSGSIREEHEKILRAAEDGNAQEMRAVLELHLGKIERETGSLLERYPQYFANEIL